MSTKDSYENWEKSQGISPSSPEALYAEKAWNAALVAARNIMGVNRPVADVLNDLITDGS